MNIFTGLLNSYRWFASFIPYDIVILLSGISVFVGLPIAVLGIRWMSGRSLKKTILGPQMVITGALLSMLPFIINFLNRFPEAPDGYKMWLSIPYPDHLIYIHNHYQAFFWGMFGLGGIIVYYSKMYPSLTYDDTGASARFPTKREVMWDYGYVDKNTVRLNILKLSVLLTFIILFVFLNIIWNIGKEFPGIYTLSSLWLTINTGLFFLTFFGIEFALSKLPRKYDPIELVTLKGKIKKFFIDISKLLSHYFEVTRDFFPLGYLVLGKDTKTKNLVVLKGINRNIHTGIWGPSGSHKTEGYIYSSILADIWHSDRSIFVIDNKSPEMFNILAGAAFANNMRVIFFDPWKPQYCPQFNPLAGIPFNLHDGMKYEKDVYKHISYLCDLFIGTTLDIDVSNKDQVFFKARTRLFMELVFMLIYTFNEEERNMGHARDIIDSVSNMRSYVDNIKSQNSFVNKIQNQWFDFDKTSGDTRTSTLTSVKDALSPFTDPDVRKVFMKSSFKLNDLYDKDKRTLMIIGCPSQKPNSAVLASLFTKMAIHAAFVETGIGKEFEMALATKDTIAGIGIDEDTKKRMLSKRGVILNIEEGDSIRIDILPVILKLARYTGTHLNYIGQDPSSLMTMYKDWRSIETNISTRLYAGGLSGDVIKDLSLKIGKTVVQDVRLSSKNFFQKGDQQTPRVTELMSPSDIEHLPENRFILFPNNKGIRPFQVEAASRYNSDLFRKMLRKLPENPPVFKTYENEKQIEMKPHSPETAYRIPEPEGDSVLPTEHGKAQDTVTVKSGDVIDIGSPEWKERKKELQKKKGTKKPVFNLNVGNTEDTQVVNGDTYDSADTLTEEDGVSVQPQRDVFELYPKLKEEFDKLREKANFSDTEANEMKQIISNLQEADTKKAEEINSLKDEVMFDALTKLYNRRTFDNRIGEEFSKFTRHKTKFSIFVIDIDKFKDFNDKHGHQTGDEVLHHVASLVKSNIRIEDIPCRYGGEEFVVIFPETNLDGAHITSDKIRKVIESTPMENGKGPLKVTISGGVAEIKEGITVKMLIEEADKLLYTAKENGRNQVLKNV